MTAGYNLDITVAELRAIVSDSEHDAHNFLWSDGATTWELDILFDELGDTEEALLGMGPESELHLEAVDLSEQGQRAFIEGYCEDAPAAYDSEADCANSPTPWCAPWSWDSDWRADFYHSAQHADFDPLEMGRRRARQDYAELSELLAEEAASDEEEAPEIRYEVGNVWNVGPYDRLWDSLEEAMAFMERNGYVYVDSAAYGPNGEDAYYFVRPDHAEEKGIDTSRPGWEYADDLLDKVYGYGYEPCLLPVIRD